VSVFGESTMYIFKIFHFDETLMTVRCHLGFFLFTVIHGINYILLTAVIP